LRRKTFSEDINNNCIEQINGVVEMKGVCRNPLKVLMGGDCLRECTFLKEKRSQRLEMATFFSPIPVLLISIRNITILTHFKHNKAIIKPLSRRQAFVHYLHHIEDVLPPFYAALSLPARRYKRSILSLR